MNNKEKASILAKKTGLNIYSSGGEPDGKLFIRIGQTRFSSGTAFYPHECRNIIKIYRKHGNPILFAQHIPPPSPLERVDPIEKLPSARAISFCECEIEQMEVFLAALRELEGWADE